MKYDISGLNAQTWNVIKDQKEEQTQWKSTGVLSTKDPSMVKLEFLLRYS